MKVLHIVGGINPGGVETWLLALAQDLTQLGVRSDLVFGNPKKNRLATEFRTVFGSITSVGRYSRPHEYRAALVRFLNNSDYEIVHIHTNMFAFLALSAVRGSGRSASKKIVHSHNGSFLISNSIIWRLIRLINREYCSRHADLCIGCTPRALLEIVRPDAPVKKVVLPYGIDTSRFPPRPKAQNRVNGKGITALMPARFVAQKNHKRALSIWSEVVRRHADATLILCGTGPTEGEIRHLADRLGISENVDFFGIRRDIPELMTGVADVVFLPSLWEGYPVSLVEAQAAGVPFLTSTEVETDVARFVNSGIFMSLKSSDADWAECLITLATKERQTPSTDEIRLLDVAANAEEVFGHYQAVLNGTWGQSKP